MMKYAMAILMMLILIAGCAPVTTTPPTSATPPTTTLPVVPSAPTTTILSAPTVDAPPPVTKALSFAAKIYTDDTIGFTWQYPNKWIYVEPMGADVIVLRATINSGADSAGVTVVPEVSDFDEAVKTAVENKLTGFGVKLNVTPAKAITLADGITSATESLVIAQMNTSKGVIEYYIYTIGFNKGGKTVMAWGSTTVAADNNKAFIKEIAQTLAIK